MVSSRSFVSLCGSSCSFVPLAFSFHYPSCSVVHFVPWAIFFPLAIYFPVAVWSHDAFCSICCSLSLATLFPSPEYRISWLLHKVKKKKKKTEYEIKRKIKSQTYASAFICQYVCINFIYHFFNFHFQ